MGRESITIPNKDFDGCETNGISMKCAGCAAKYLAGIKNQEICDLIESGNLAEIKRVRQENSLHKFYDNCGITSIIAR